MADDNIFGEYKKDPNRTVPEEPQGGQKQGGRIHFYQHPMFDVIESFKTESDILLTNLENPRKKEYRMQSGFSILKQKYSSNTTYAHIASMWVDGEFTPKFNGGNYYPALKPSLKNWIVETYASNIEDLITRVLDGPAKKHGATIDVLRGTLEPDDVNFY